MESYWFKALNRRLTRRRAVAVTGGTAAAAAFLAACGSDDGGSAGSTNGTTGGGTTGGTNGSGSGMLTEPFDTTIQARRGGRLNDRVAADINSLDVSLVNSALNPPARLAYNTLVRFKPGHLEPQGYELGPDMAESWEQSADGMQITLKLRPNLSWHPKAPVDGRAIDADDILFSWERFAARSPNRSGVANVVNPDAPILSVTASDAQTIVIQMKEPLVYGLELFAPNNTSHTGSILLLPKETDSTFDIAREMIGSGPYYLNHYEPSVGFTMKRFENYYDDEWGFLDEIHMPIIPEYASVVAQLKAGNVLMFPLLNAEDVLPIKSEESRLQLYATDMLAANQVLNFGWMPDGESPFIDERVRQAFSMSWERDLFIDAFYDVSNFEAQGLPMTTSWNSALAANFLDWWLDPQSDEFGENAKYFQYNPEEARRLLDAAGYSNGLPEQPSRYITTNQLGNLPRYAEVLDGMVSENGFTNRVAPIDFTTEYPALRDAQGSYEGWMYRTSAGGSGVGPVGLLANMFWSKGGNAFHGFSASGRADKSGDPEVDALIESARLEPDIERRRGLVYDVQRYLAKAMYGLHVPGGASGFTLAWPGLGNFYTYRGLQVWTHYRLWLDQTKAPFA